MRSYRLYRLDGAGRIMTAEWMEAADDDGAAEQAHDRRGGEAYELWDRQRLIARVNGCSARR